MRRINSVAPTLEAPEQNTWNLELQTMTPMFGGSAKPREVDAGNPVRAASVRGHLRFWWRATAGAKYSSAEKLFEAEEAIWGSAEKHGAVSVIVKQATASNDVQPSSFGTRQEPHERFFLHPFNSQKGRAQQPALPEATGKRDVTFTLVVSFKPDSSNDWIDAVRTAIRAWLAFGGVGARTRKGTGSLQVSSANRAEWLPGNTGELENWFVIAKAADRNRVDHPILVDARGVFGQPKRAEQAWKELSIFWARFRKGHFTQKNPVYNSRNGSSWEDHRTLQELSRDDQNIALVKPFLGLPIVYQGFGGTAFAGTLNAVAPNGSRLASPVILKPVAFADGTVRSMVLVLNAPRPSRIKIGNQELDLNVPRYDRVMTALGVQDPLEAVLKAARLSGFTEEVHL
jgi:CRISPR-associated protein Cmr1